MTGTRRLAAIVVAVAAHLTLFSGPSRAEFPDRPLTVVVATTAGGPSDVIARIAADGLSKRLNQPVIVANRPGANTAIGYQSFVRSNPDGYTLFLMTAVTSSLPLMQQGFVGEPVESVEPIALLAMNSIAIIARGNAPFSTLPEMIAYGRANPGKISSATVGGLPELLSRYLFQKEGVSVTHVSYKGASEITNELLGQRVDVGFYSLVGMSGHVAEGRVKVLAMTGKTRSPSRPGIATIAETIPGLYLEDINYFGLVAPKGTPPDVLAKLHKALVEVGQTDDFQAKVKSLDSMPGVSTPQEFRSLLATIANWKAMAKEVGFTPR